MVEPEKQIDKPRCWVTLMRISKKPLALTFDRFECRGLYKTLCVNSPGLALHGGIPAHQGIGKGGGGGGRGGEAKVGRIAVNVGVEAQRRARSVEDSEKAFS